MTFVPRVNPASTARATQVAKDSGGVAEAGMKARLERLARGLGRGFDARLQPGDGWSYLPREKQITYPAEQLLTHSDRHNMGAILREHARATYSRPLLEAVAAEPGLRYLWQCVEEARTGAIQNSRLSGARALRKELYDGSFVPAAGETRAEQLGRAMMSLSADELDKVPEGIHPEVVEALEELRPALREAIRLPDNVDLRVDDLTAEEIEAAAAKSLETVKAKLWPSFERLMQRDVDHPLREAKGSSVGREGRADAEAGQTQRGDQGAGEPGAGRQAEGKEPGGDVGEDADAAGKNPAAKSASGRTDDVTEGSPEQTGEADGEAAKGAAGEGEAAEGPTGEGEATDATASGKGEAGGPGAEEGVAGEDDAKPQSGALTGTGRAGRSSGQRPEGVSPSTKPSSGIEPRRALDEALARAADELEPASSELEEVIPGIPGHVTQEEMLERTPEVEVSGNPIADDFEAQIAALQRQLRFQRDSVLPSAYEEMKRAQKANSDQLVSAIRAQVELEINPKKQGHSRQGAFDVKKALQARLEKAATGRADPKVFLRPGDPQKPDVEFIMAIDTTGSMRGDAIDAARHTWVMAREALLELELPFASLKLGGRPEIIEAFGRNDQLNLDDALAMLHARGSNNEAAGLDMGAKLFAESTARTRVLIVITDGGAQKGTADKVTELMDKTKIKVVGVGIGKGVGSVPEVYREHHVTVPNLYDLPKKLAEVIQAAVVNG